MKNPDGRQPVRQNHLRAQDNQSTMGAYVGRPAQKDGKVTCDGQLALRGRQGRTADRRGIEAAALGAVWHVPGRPAGPRRPSRRGACSGADPGCLGRDRPRASAKSCRMTAVLCPSAPAQRVRSSIRRCVSPMRSEAGGEGWSRSHWRSPISTTCSASSSLQGRSRQRHQARLRR